MSDKEGLGERLHRTADKIQGAVSHVGREIHRGSAKPTSSEIVQEYLDWGLKTRIMVADSVLAPVDQQWTDLADKGLVDRWVMPSERSIPAVAVGKFTATGEASIMDMQNTGGSHALEYKWTMMDPLEVPGVFMWSWRGHNDTETSLPHIIIGNLTDRLSRVGFAKKDIFGRRDGVGYLRDMERGLTRLFEGKGQRENWGHSVLLRLSPDGFKPDYPLRKPEETDLQYFNPDEYRRISELKGRSFEEVQATPKMTREQLLCLIVEREGKDKFYFVGNGYDPRAFQALGLTGGYLLVDGGFGSVAAAVWGAAKSNPAQGFIGVCGDQNIVNSEMDKVYSSDSPKNATVYVGNNRTGESVGPSRSLPLSQAHYDLFKIYNTINEEPVPYKYKRVGAFGPLFESQEALELAEAIGDHPAMMVLARRWLVEKQADRDAARKEGAWDRDGIFRDAFAT